MFPSHCQQVLAHNDSFDCWDFFHIIVESLSYNINCLEGYVLFGTNKKMELKDQSASSTTGYYSANKLFVQH